MSDTVVLVEPTREVVEVLADGDRAVYVVEPVITGGGDGVTDHGELDGLADDDHPHYLTVPRGDARYYQQTEVDKLLEPKADAADLADVATSGAYADLTGRPTIPATYADLTGLLPTAALPALAIVSTTVVGSQTAMLALTAQRGDVAVRSDIAATFILAGTDPTSYVDWVRLPVPTDLVLSVNGQTGVVVLGKGDVGLGNVSNLAPADLPVSTATAAAIAARALDAAVVHLAGAETVTGAKNFTGGLTAAGAAVVVTTDTRLADARTPLAHVHPATDVTGLAAVATTGAYADLSGKPAIPDSPDDIGAAPASHSHPLSDATDLDETGKAAGLAVVVNDAGTGYKLTEISSGGGGFCDPVARRHGLLSVTAAPTAQNDSGRPPAGRLNTWRLAGEPGMTIGQVALLLADTAVGPGSCWVMVNQLDGTRLGITADIGSGSSPSPITGGRNKGFRFFNLVTPGVMTGDGVYLTVLHTMSSGPNIVFGQYIGGDVAWWNVPGRLTAFRSDPDMYAAPPNDAAFTSYLAAGIPWVDMIVGFGGPP